MLLISVELLIMLCILLFVPGDYAGPCFIGFAIGESLGAAALRIAGGIFTKIADIGSDLMKIVFNIKEDDARNPGVIADCTGDNAGDSVGPTADGFETYGVTGVALITFILLAVPEPAVQVQLLVWIFVMRVMMIVASGVSYLHQRGDREGPLRQRRQDELRGAAHLAGLAHLDRLGGAHLRRLLPAHPRPRRRHACGGSSRPSSPAARSPARSSPSWSRSSPRPSRATCARSSPPRARAAPRSTSSPASSPATSAPTGWASSIVVLMGIAYLVSTLGLGAADARAGRVRLRPGGLRLPRHGPGDHRGRLLRPGHRQRAVGLRALDHRDSCPTSSRRSRRTSASTPTSRRPSTSSRRTTAPATPSRPPPSRC